MTDPIAFVLAVVALLATPGPTNTLLATSGATGGLKTSLKLLIAEAVGYMISITILSVVVGPLAHASPVIGMILRGACAIYLIFTAWKLWIESANVFTSGEGIKFHRVLTTTLLNPKSIIFSFVIVPYLSERHWLEALPYMAALLIMISCVGFAWICMGALIRSGKVLKIESSLVRRAGSITLAVFAAILASSVMVSLQAQAHEVQAPEAGKSTYVPPSRPSETSASSRR